VGEGDGGAILAQAGRLSLRGVEFRGNFAGRNGGAIATTGEANFWVRDCGFSENRSANVGGAISVEGLSDGSIERCLFSNNQAAVFGSDLNFASSKVLGWAGNSHDGRSEIVLIENPLGKLYATGNTFDGAPAHIDSTGTALLFGNLFNLPGDGTQRAETARPPADRPEALCNDFGSNAFRSLGYNISADDSCALDQDTDLPNTDPELAVNDEGFLAPRPGSPAIDSGATDVVVFEGQELASLPCGYRDLTGTARPQDANGDGVFECDRGAIEIPGAGAITAGHSGAFFNAGRDREGTYVEILNETTAVVYTFTYRPDGSGPAWFIGVGAIGGNSIVIDELLRPVGASFGEDFDPADVAFTPIGGMSMIFSDCQAAAPGGNVAYSGEAELGYEGLITRATRLSHILGCGSETPHPNAGLSASYFDPERDGEGIIVEWLTNGQVLVVFFTYDQDGNQLWLLGVGTPEGKTVTMDALYASAYTRWGRAFDTDEITLSIWGTFTLTWTACGTVNFAYASTVPGYGSATRDYSRLSTLHGTTCPEF
jgi:predicted outer membrane repeat protein